MSWNAETFGVVYGPGASVLKMTSLILILDNLIGAEQVLIDFVQDQSKQLSDALNSVELRPLRVGSLLSLETWAKKVDIERLKPCKTSWEATWKILRELSPPLSVLNNASVYRKVESYGKRFSKLNSRKKKDLLWEEVTVDGKKQASALTAWRKSSEEEVTAASDVLEVSLCLPIHDVQDQRQLYDRVLVLQLGMINRGSTSSFAVVVHFVALLKLGSSLLNPVFLELSIQSNDAKLLRWSK